MKNFNLYKFAITSAFMALSGCGKDFLTVEPNDQINTGNFYSNQLEAVAATNAVYVPLLQFYNESGWAFGDIMSDDTEVGGGGGGDGAELLELDNFTMTSQNPVVRIAWGACYKAIQRANLVIEKVPSISASEIDEKVKNRCIGEAHFLRALFYFNLVRLYGDVPLYTKSIVLDDAKTIKRSPAANVYAQIIEDLLKAETLLPNRYTGDDVGRASAGSAKGLLAKVYLTTGQKTEAAAKAKEVIDNKGLYGYGLNTNYGDNYSLATENSQECLFAVQYRSGGGQWGNPNSQGNRLNTFFAPRLKNIVASAGYGFNIPTLEMFNQFEAGDARRVPSMWIPGDNFKEGTLDYTQEASLTGSPNGFNVRKFFVPITNVTGDSDGWRSSLNYNILRYSEILLIYAEASGSGVGLASLNLVRQRAGVADIATGLSDQQFLDAVYKERRVELAFEGHRWFDLLRHPNDPEYFVKVMQKAGKNASSFNRFMPIPQSEIDANPSLTQNSGY
ncbi:MAG: RagB/SusD family nutrient uptake outer membrane protein [Cytophagales bacterium]